MACGRFMCMEKMVYLLRHGQSEANVARVYQGLDSPLNEAGRGQAENVAERVAKLEFDVLLSSPLKRARQTAERISEKTGKEAEYVDLFVERVKPTDILDKPYEDKEAEALWREWEKSFRIAGVKAEDGESFEEVAERAGRALDYLRERPEEGMVVVTHGFFLRMIMAKVLLGDLLSVEVFANYIKATSVKNTGITVLKYVGGFEEESAWRLWVYNDHSHLG